MQSHDRTKCDLIMRGGITSGIVYPSAVLALRESGYSFSSIGGASAGAIAAAATAAAQFGEMVGEGAGPEGRKLRGFAALTALQGELATPGLMRQLFRPTTKARPAFELLLKMQETKGTRRKVVVALAVLLKRMWVQTTAWVLVALTALAFMVSRFGGGDRRTVGAWITLGLILLIVAALALGASSAFRAWRLFSDHLPSNFYGICSGMSFAEDEPPALTEWLHEKIQGCAGLPPGEPLTFGHLDQKGIRLRMMTTDLTYAIPVPFSSKADDSLDSPYLFAIEDFRRLFPREVIDRMIQDSTPVEAADVEVKLRSLPSGKLPVIVATRMSLSFPVLLSAVPLWTLNGDTAVRHWMSDGGITSNFPIHFFDAWLPTKPTFGLNLIPARRAGDPGAQERARMFDEDPYVHRPPRRRAEIQSMIGFLGQILDTMQNWRDLLQSELPGFRDRIQPIELEPHEGGMNLTMPREVIEGLIAKGSDAGLSLAANFDWSQHRIERYRTLMHLLDREINKGEGSNPGMRLAFETHIKELLLPPSDRSPQTPTEDWGPGALERTAAFLVPPTTWEDYFVREDGHLRPDPALRVTPKE